MVLAIPKLRKGSCCPTGWSSAATGRTDAGIGRNHLLPARSLDPADGEADRDLAHRPVVEVAYFDHGQKTSTHRFRGLTVRGPVRGQPGDLSRAPTSGRRGRGAAWQCRRTHNAANLMQVTPKSSLRLAEGVAVLGLRPARRRGGAGPVRPDRRALSEKVPQVASPDTPGRSRDCGHVSVPCDGSDDEPGEALPPRWRRLRARRRESSGIADPW